jgi:hypothetical protein
MYARNFFIVVMMFFVAMTVGCRSKRTAETSGEVTNVSVERDKTTTITKTDLGQTKSKTKISYKTEITYNYIISGKIYTGHAKKSSGMQSSFNIGSLVLVCYNPENPQDSDVFPAKSKCPPYSLVRMMTSKNST